MGKLFACFGGGFKCNRRVESFEKTHAFLANVPEEVYRHSRTIQELLLGSNNIKELPKQFFKLVNLKKLNLSDNDLSNLGQELSQLSQLVELDLSRNDLGRIPETIKMLAYLESVDFSANPLTRIPETMCSLSSLRHLKINAISLERFPENFGDLETLETLEARENMVTELPESICSLTSLQYLDLGENEINGLPENFGQLKNLLELWIDDNDLTTLPDSIGGLVNLTLADFTKNKLEKIPETISLCINLSVLTLKENYLSILPSSIGTLKKLSELTVDNNKLYELTDSIGECTGLTELILTENLIQHLPESIENLSQIGVLNVGRNRITHLPEQIGKCRKLRMLFLRENHLEKIPDTIGDLKSLQTLDVAGNRLDYLPASLLQLDIKAVWLSANQAQPLVAFQEDFVLENGQQKKVLTCFLLPQHKFPKEEAPMDAPMGHRYPTDENLPNAPDIAPKSYKVGFENGNIPSDDPEPIDNPFDRNDGIRKTPLPKKVDERKQEAQEKARKKQIEEQQKLEHDAKEEREEDELNPLIPETESLEDSREPQPTGVRFNSPQDEEPMEHRLKQNTPHYKRDARLTNLEAATGNLVLDNKPNLNLSSSPLVIELKLPGSGNYGLSIAGGLGSPPYIEGDNAVFISRVTVDGRAELAGIEVGDKIAEVNGHDVIEKTHEDVVEILRECRETDQSPVFVLYRYPLTQGFEPLVNESDSEEDEEVTATENSALISNAAGINAQLDFSVLSSEGEEKDMEPLPIPDLLPTSTYEEMPPPPLQPEPEEIQLTSSVIEPETVDPSIPEPLSDPEAILPIISDPDPVELTPAVITPPPTVTTPIASATIPAQPIDFQSPKPFISPDKVASQLQDGAQMSFKEKMKMFKTAPSTSRPQARTKISLVNNQDLSSIRADEQRKLISQSAAQLRHEKFFDLDNNDELYQQTADLDSGPSGDAVPKIRKPSVGPKMENPLASLGGSTSSRETDLSQLEREASLSLGNSVSPREWERDVERSRRLRMERMKQMDNDAQKAQKVLRRERSLKGESNGMPTTR